MASRREPRDIGRLNRTVRQRRRIRVCSCLPDSERVEVTSDDVAMGASGLVILVRCGAFLSMRYGTPLDAQPVEHYGRLGVRKKCLIDDGFG